MYCQSVLRDIAQDGPQDGPQIRPEIVPQFVPQFGPQFAPIKNVPLQRHRRERQLVPKEARVVRVPKVFLCRA